MTTSLWPLSTTRQLRKVRFEIAYGATVRFLRGGTTTPLTVYLDSAATTPAETGNLTVDGNGTWPALFVPYGEYDYRVLDGDGTIIVTASNVPNPQPFDEAVATNPESLCRTGMTMWMPGDTTFSGFVRMNGRTVGSSASSATERANDDCEDLFTWIWNNLADGQAAVAGGRGATAAADWGANKVITLPDLRGRSPFGLDDMGSSAAGRLGSVTFSSGDATTPGSVGGAETVTLAEANIPAHEHGVGTIATTNAGSHQHGPGSLTTNVAGNHGHGVTDPTHVHPIPSAGNILIQSGGTGLSGAPGGEQVPSSNTYSFINPSQAVQAAATGIGIQAAGNHAHSVTSGATAAAGDHTHSMTGATANAGSGTAFSIVPPLLLGSWYIKL